MTALEQGDASGEEREPSLAPIASVKGLAFRTNIECFSKLHGRQRLEIALNTCPIELRDAIRFHRIVVGGWYPIEWYRLLMRSFIVGGGGNADVLIRAIGRASTDRDLHGIYRNLLRLLAPGTLVSLYARLFSRYYSSGRLTVDSSEANYMLVTLSECTGFDRNMYLEILGSAERLIELSGGSEPRTRIIAGGRDGVDHATIEGRWQ